MKASFNSTLDQMSDGEGPATAGGSLQHTAMKRDEDIPDEINNHEHTNAPGKGTNHFRGKSSYENSELGGFEFASRSEILTQVTISYTDWYSILLPFAFSLLTSRPPKTKTLKALRALCCTSRTDTDTPRNHPDCPCPNPVSPCPSRSSHFCRPCTSA
jgi:hypothetical protein